MGALYVRLDENVKARWEAIARKAGLSVAKATEALIAGACGQQHPLAGAVAEAMAQAAKKPKGKKQ